MTLRDNLYIVNVRDIAEQSAVYTLQLNEGCVIYKAHFPGVPVTPGVCMIGMVTELLSDLTGKAQTLCGVKNAKFLMPLVPDGKPVNVTFSKVRTSEEGECTAQAVMTDLNGNIYAKITLSTYAS